MRRGYFMVLGITIIFVMFTSACSRVTNLLNPEIEGFITAKEIELENYLIDFEEIDDASVKLVLEKNAASVVLNLSDTINTTEIDDIIQFISQSVENIDKEKIQIKDQDDTAIYPIS